MTNDYFPTEFSVTIGDMPGLATLLEWSGTQFALTCPSMEIALTTLSPLKQAWQSFWLSMDELGVWSWDSEYINDDVIDGVCWSLRLAYGNKRIASEGMNAFPGQTIPDPEYTPEFARFLKAVEKLVATKGIFL